MKWNLTFYIKSVCYCLYYEHVGVKRAAKIIETGPEVVTKKPGSDEKNEVSEKIG